MKKKLIFALILTAFITPNITFAITKSITIDWTIQDTTNITGYEMYYSYDNGMSSSALACSTNAPEATTLTCPNITIDQYPIYLIIRAKTPETNLDSPVTSYGSTISMVQNFFVLSEDSNSQIDNKVISITNVNPSNYQITNFNIGNTNYIDRDYIINDIPAELEGALGIKTANADKLNNSSSFLTFDIDNDATLYIAYDSRANPYPSWLTSNYELTSFALKNSDSSLGHFSIWQRPLSAGIVSIPGNLYNSPVNVGTNYFILIK